MYDPFRDYDAWKTASSYDDTPEPTCPFCKAYLPEEPAREIEEVITTTCYGRDCPNRRNPDVMDVMKIPGRNIWTRTIRCRETRYLWYCKECGNEFLD